MHGDIFLKTVITCVGPSAVCTSGITPHLHLVTYSPDLTLQLPMAVPLYISIVRSPSSKRVHCSIWSPALC